MFGPTVWIYGIDGGVVAHVEVLESACWFFNNKKQNVQYIFWKFASFTKEDLFNLTNFIYLDILPETLTRLFILNQLAARIRYSALEKATAERLAHFYEENRTETHTAMLKQHLYMANLLGQYVLYYQLCSLLVRCDLETRNE